MLQKKTTFKNRPNKSAPKNEAQEEKKVESTSVEAENGSLPATEKHLTPEEELAKEREESGFWKSKSAELLNQIESYKHQTLEMFRYRVKKLFRSLLTFLDSFEMSIKASSSEKVDPKIKPYLKGFEISRIELGRIMDAEEVKKMEIKVFEDTFDVNKHEVIEKQTNLEYPNLTVLEVLREGYYLGKEVLREAWVVVNVIPQKREEVEEKKAQ